MGTGVNTPADPAAAPHLTWSQFQPMLWPAALFAAFVLGAIWLVDPFGESTTLGQISVDTPEIYTRERLVNDRFLQDAWLTRELDRESINPGQQTFAERRNTSLRFGESGDTSTAKTVGDSSKSSGEKAEGDARLSSRALLLEAVDYRDVVRNLAIENQLDDRHDLNGNSLYKLKFDAAVLPGTNTQASAQITVRLVPPEFLAALSKKTTLASVPALGKSEHIEAWRSTYLKWIDNLSLRLNQTQKELKQAFHNNEFAHNDYARLIAFLGRNLQVSPRSLPPCRAEVLELHGQDRKPLRLSPHEHSERKACVAALVEKTVLTPAYLVDTTAAVLNAPSELGKYLPGLEANKARTAAADPVREKVVEDLLNQRLNSYFATTTVRLVLGLTVPESSFVSDAYYEIPAFQSLVKLTFFNPFQKSSEGDAFTVKQRIAAIAAIDKERMKSDDDLNLLYKRDEHYWGGLYEGRADPRPSQYKDFAADLLPKINLSVSRIDLNEVQKDGIELTASDFKDVSGGSGLHVALAEVGLLNFARLAKKHILAFTYSVTPKESSDSVSFTLSTDSAVEGRAAKSGKGTSAMADIRREAISRSLERRNAVVGFSNFQDDGSAEFGWLISPRHTILDGPRHVQVQTPAQYPLSALVSLPSWWNQARLHITTSWVGRNGQVIRGKTTSATHVIDVPTDFEPLEAILLGIEQLGPELMETRLDPVLLTACKPGAIVIPGRRLWRSTRVTLGYQTADSIAVLPNMKGIIARFAEVQNQASVSEEETRASGKSLEIRRPVRVWTSQGSVTLPTPARIGVPITDCPGKK